MVEKNITGCILCQAMTPQHHKQAVNIVNFTSANVVIQKLDDVFVTYGTPRPLRSDNGPPFNSHEFCKFAENLGFFTGR